MSMTDIIAEMSRTAEAAARVPDLEAQLNVTRGERDASMSHNQRLEENIIRYKAQIESLNQRIASLEVERDQHGFRALEAEDVVEKLRSVLSTLAGEVGSALKASEKPVEPKLPDEPGLAVADLGHQDRPFSGDVTPKADERASVPTVPQASMDQTNVSTGPSASLDVVSGPAPTADPSPSMPYAGLRYWDHPAYVSLNNWLEGGGTEEGYRWKPEEANRN